MLDRLKIAAGQHPREKSYWLEQLAGAPTKTIFPYGGVLAGPGVNRAGGHREVVRFGWGNPLFARLIALSGQSDIRLHMILAAGAAALLHRCGASTDLMVGMPVYKQDTGGDYINKALVLRIRFTPDLTFRELLNRVRQTISEAVANQDYPLEVLVGDLGLVAGEQGFPLFDIAIVLENIQDKNDLKHVSANMIFSFRRFEDRIEGEVEYNPAEYGEPALRRSMGHLESLLAGVTADLALPLREIEILSRGERELLEHLNDTAAAYPADSWIHEIFARQAGKTPDQVAVVGKLQIPNSKLQTNSKQSGALRADSEAYGEGQVSYGELSARAAGLARCLQEKGVGADSIVGIMVERSVAMIAGMLGILKAGGAYLPMDVRLPAERIDYMLADSNAAILVKPGGLFSDSSGIKGIDTVWLDDLPLFPAAPPALFNMSAHPSVNLAYVIYTSGSTGKPKGVLVRHGNVLRLVKGTNYMDWQEGERLLLTGATAFDITTFEIWGPLLNGLTLVLAEEGIILEAEKLGRFIAAHQVSILHLIPQLFNQLVVMNPGIFAGLRYFLIGGDLVQPHYVNRLRNRYPHLRILHMYGPTENTTFSTFFPVEREYETALPIGKPLGNSTVYIVDYYHRLQPPGLAGELWVGGAGVARGYLNNPELTADKFTNQTLLRGVQGAGVRRTHPIKACSVAVDVFDNSTCTCHLHLSPLEEKSPPGRRRQTLYRTGDLAQWLPEGNIEFLGRRDYQVKIRGIRIESGEIESLLLSHERIREAVVIDRRRGSEGEKYLCAYIVLHEPGELEESGAISAELREYLADRLPEVMIPSYFIPLARIPLTPNGKVDRKALPEPGPEGGEAVEAPRNRREEQLAGIWAEVLEMERDKIGTQANFFRLGGHSLKAAILVSRIHRAMGVSVSIAAVFENPTIRELAAYIGGLAVLAGPAQRIDPVEKQDYYPLAPAQKRMYFLQQLDLESTGYNIIQVIELDGEPRRQRFEETFAGLIRRHEGLRTALVMVGDQPVQRVGAAGAVEFKVEFHGLPAGTRAEEIVKTGRGFVRPFDLARAPLIRVGLIQTGDGKNILMVDMHHVVSDEISHNILINDYLLLARGSGLPALRCQYKDYARWQGQRMGQAVFSEHEAYWLKECSPPPPELNLPLDYPRPHLSGGRDLDGRAEDGSLDAHILGQLRTLAEKENLTLYMVVLALFNVLLFKLTRQGDITVGTVAAARMHADMERIIGMFANTLVIRNFPGEDQPFDVFLKEVKDRALQVFAHQEYPFEEVVDKVLKKRKPGRNPLFDVFYSFVSLSDDAGSSDSTPMPLEEYIDFSFPVKFDLALTVVEYKDRLGFKFTYRVNLFKQETIQRFVRYFSEISEAVIGNHRTCLKDITVSLDLGAAAPGQLLADGADFDF